MTREGRQNPMDFQELLTEARRLSNDERAALVQEPVQGAAADLDHEKALPLTAGAVEAVEEDERGTTISWSEAYRRVHLAAERRGSWS